MFHLCGDGNDGARRHRDSLFAPLLIPAAARHADQHLYGLVMYMPVVAATRLEGDIEESQSVVAHRCQIAVARKILSVWIQLALRPDTYGQVGGLLDARGTDVVDGLAAAGSLVGSHGGGQHGGNASEFVFAHTHVQGTADVRTQLRFTTGKG